MGLSILSASLDIFADMPVLCKHGNQQPAIDCAFMRTAWICSEMSKQSVCETTFASPRESVSGTPFAKWLVIKALCLVASLIVDAIHSVTQHIQSPFEYEGNFVECDECERGEKVNATWTWRTMLLPSSHEECYAVCISRTALNWNQRLTIK